MDSTVTENMETTDDRLEIVLRDPSKLLHDIKPGLILLAIPWTITIGYRILQVVAPTVYKHSIGFIFLCLSSLASLFLMLVIALYLKRIQRLRINDSEIVIAKGESAKRINTADISEIIVETPKTYFATDSLVLKLVLTSGKSERIPLNARDLLKARQLEPLLTSLESLGKPINPTRRLSHLLRVRFGSNDLSEQTTLADLVGTERVKTTIFEGSEEFERLTITPNQGLVIGAVFSLLLFVGPALQWHTIAIFLPIAFFPLVFVALQKPLYFVVGNKGIGVWTDGRYAYVLPFNQLQTLRFTESVINREEGMMKASIRFLDGEELRFELKVRTPEDRETLRQIAQEFKELKHGD